MSGVTIRLGIGALLLIHGFAHWHVTSGWQAGTAAHSWLLGAGEGAQGLAAGLWAVSLLAFLLAGVVVLAHHAWRRPLLVAAAGVSLLTLGLFWQPSLLLGVLVDAALLVLLLRAPWTAGRWAAQRRATPHARSPA
jgi:hypothetical protein